ncbi:MAG: MFS transporter [Caldilineaceae bacterium]
MLENDPQEVAFAPTEATTTSSNQPIRHERRNWLAFFFDYVMFGLALTILNPNTTMPAFAARLTDSKVLIGLVGTIWFGGWLLPQLFAANYLNTQARKLPHLLRAAWVGRPFFFVFALFLWWGGATYPAWILFVFLAGFLLFMLTDGFAALAYFDMLGKSMSAKGRSRMLGSAQATRGILTLGIGWWIQRLLSAEGPTFPVNYAAVFGLAGLFLMLALLASYFIVEPPGVVESSMTRWRDYFPRLRSLLRNDRSFVRITAVRLLAGLHMLAGSFYVIYATQVANQPEAAVALFFTTQTIGGAIGGVILGLVATRFGSRRVVQISVCCDLATITVALIMAALGKPEETAWLFPVIFGLLGVIDAAMMLGYFNYVLDIAPHTERATYIGLTNTLAGLLAIAPIAGGWILEQSSYVVLFAATALMILPALFLAWSLPQSGKITENHT